MNRKRELKEIQVSLERIVYQDEENGFTVARANPSSSLEDQITVVGNLPSVFPGQKLTLSGFWDHHSQYGRQFKVKKCNIDLPATEAGIEKYLASSFIKGIGPVIAERITDRFGKDSLNIIDQNPDKLGEVEGVGPHRLRRIKNGWKEGKEIRNIMIFLKEYGISTSYSVKIFKEYGKDTVEVLRDDPYKLAQDVFGIGFKTADNIARKLGLRESDPARIKAGIEFVLQEATNNGHLFLPRDDLIEKSSALLGLGKDNVTSAVQDLIVDERLIVERDLGRGTPIYLAPLYFGEVGVANKISSVQKLEPRINENSLNRLIKKFTDSTSVEYNEDQIKAIRKSITGKVLVITGGPGTGKTTVLKGIIELMEELDKKVALAAPTGRAAKRLEQATGREAKTIHRLLGFKPPNTFEYGEENKLTADVVVIDEMSMVDLLLANNLFKAVSSGTKLILVGDKDQLPSVGPGNVLQDLLDSGVVAKLELTEIFRQAKTSKIVTNAHRINRGEFPVLSNKREGDFFFIEEENPSGVAKKITDLAAERLPRRYGVDPVKDIQVLSPMHRGPAGVDDLNERLQNRLNSNSPLDLPLTKNEFRINDKVMQIKNDYEKEVFNGDIGQIRELKERGKELVIEFPDSGLVAYDIGDLSQLKLAYAITIHKSQGSEYPVVLIPLLTQHYVMLQRNLLYTGLTRAKSLAVLVGSKKAVGIAVNNDEVEKRFTLLSERLVKAVSG